MREGGRVDANGKIDPGSGSEGRRVELQVRTAAMHAAAEMGAAAHTAYKGGFKEDPGAADALAELVSAANAAAEQRFGEFAESGIASDPAAAGRDADADRMFCMFDLDGDGRVTRDELRAVIGDVWAAEEDESGVAGAAADELVAMIDADDDGTVSAEEFARFRASLKVLGSLPGADAATKAVIDGIAGATKEDDSVSEAKARRRRAKSEGGRRFRRRFRFRFRFRRRRRVVRDERAHFARRRRRPPTRRERKSAIRRACSPTRARSTTPSRRGGGGGGDGAAAASPRAPAGSGSRDGRDSPRRVSGAQGKIRRRGGMATGVGFDARGSSRDGARALLPTHVQDAREHEPVGTVGAVRAAAGGRRARQGLYRAALLHAEGRPRARAETLRKWGVMEFGAGESAAAAGLFERALNVLEEAEAAAKAAEEVQGERGEAVSTAPPTPTETRRTSQTTRTTDSDPPTIPILPIPAYRPRTPGRNPRRRFAPRRLWCSTRGRRRSLARAI